MTRSLRIAVPLLALALAGCSNTNEPEHVDNFNSTTPKGFTIYNTPNAWVESNGFLAAGPAASQSVAIRDGATIGDGWVETVTDQAGDGGLVLRFQGPGSYYLLAIRDDSRYGYANMQIYRWENGFDTDLTGQYDILFPPGMKRTFRFEAVGSRLVGYVDGQQVLEATDPTFTSGGFGVRHNQAPGEFGLISRYDLLRWN